MGECSFVLRLSKSRLHDTYEHSEIIKVNESIASLTDCSENELT